MAKFKIKKMEQTAVEWLQEQLEKKGNASVNVSIGSMQISIKEEDYNNLFEQAKEMEKEQIIKAYDKGNSYMFEKSGEKYYNETFNK